MSDTKIEWATKVWNPLRGCSKVSEGCRNCYAIRQARRFSGSGQPYEGLTERTAVGPNWTGKVRLVPEMLGEPFKWRNPERVFVNSMSDLFHPEVPFDYIDEVFAVMALATQHTFMILTKRPDRMLEWFKSVGSRRPIPGHRVSTGDSPFCTGGACKTHDAEVGYCGSPWPLPNVWLGVSVENQEAADERITLLLQTPAAVRFLSCEPLLGPISIPHVIMEMIDWGDGPREWGDGAGIINWIIAGGESGPKARPMNPDWVRSLRDQCQATGVAFHFKQWGEWMPDPDVVFTPRNIDNIGWFTPDGFAPDDVGAQYNGEEYIHRIGKKAAGRLLDGREWNEFPEVHT